MHNRFRYTGEQYDPVTGQYYLRARYYNPVIARFTQEDTYYGDGLNLYTYCQNNPILYHDPTGHGTKENSPYSKREQQYVDVGADPDTAKLAAQCYPDAKSKQDLYNKYKSQGYNATDAKKLANYEIIHGENNAKNYAANNVKKSGTDYTATSSRENPNTDWRTLNRLNAGAGESGSSSIDIDAIRPKLKTEPDTAFFWSGRTDGIGGAENAANIAKSRGGVTLESTIETQNIVMPEWDFNNPSTMEAWDLASGAYAEQVSGEIRAVIGSELRPGNIWENVELPRLKNNPNVTKITTIDPKTGVENVIFERCENENYR